MTKKLDKYEIAIVPLANFDDEPTEEELKHIIAFISDIYSEMVQYLSED